jgi:hypothetical protein
VRNDRANELRHAGYDREATALLRGLLADDERCDDAWVHLGNIAFAAKGPKAALQLYDRGPLRASWPSATKPTTFTRCGTASPTRRGSRIR